MTPNPTQTNVSKTANLNELSKKKPQKPNPNKPIQTIQPETTNLNKQTRSIHREQFNLNVKIQSRQPKRVSPNEAIKTNQTKQSKRTIRNNRNGTVN